MGCDIHAFVEVKKDNKWLCIQEVDVARNYGLFAKLAGVRARAVEDEPDPIIPISEPRGLPEDISEVVRIENDAWDSDGHSHSWISKEEFEQVKEFFKKYFKAESWKLINQFSYKLQYIEDYEQYQDVRLVFWFDN